MLGKNGAPEGAALSCGGRGSLPRWYGEAWACVHRVWREPLDQKTGLKFSLRAGEEEARFNGEGCFGVGLLEMANKNISQINNDSCISLLHAAFEMYFIKKLFAVYQKFKFNRVPWHILLGVVSDKSWASSGFFLSEMIVSPDLSGCASGNSENEIFLPVSFLLRVSRWIDPVESFISLSGSESLVQSQILLVGKFLCGKGWGSPEVVLTLSVLQDSSQQDMVLGQPNSKMQMASSQCLT